MSCDWKNLIEFGNACVREDEFRLTLASRLVTHEEYIECYEGAQEDKAVAHSA